MIGIHSKVYSSQRSGAFSNVLFCSVLVIVMKKISSSLVLLCVVVSILLLACSHDGEALAPLPGGSINAANRREMKTSEVTKQFHLDPFHSTPEEFQNVGFTLKTDWKMFSVHNRQELKNIKSLVLLVISCIWLKLVERNHMMIVRSSFSKYSVLKLFSVHTKTKNRRYRIPPFWKYHVGDRLLWTVGLTVGIKLRFRDGLV